MPTNLHLSPTLPTAGTDVGQRTRRRIAYRLLPFVFLLYVVNYIDRVNVSFANLKMSADLGFSDSVYGLGRITGKRKRSAHRYFLSSRGAWGVLLS